MRSAWPDDYHNNDRYTVSELDATLMAQDVRLILIDELAEILKCGLSMHRKILGELRRITHDLQINIVAASVKGLTHALNLDAQLETRFRRVVEIPPWVESQQFRNFVFGLEHFLPFAKRSFLDGTEVTQWLLLHSKNTEDVVNLIKDAALVALGEDAPAVTLGHLKEAGRAAGPPPITLKYSS